MIDRKIDGHSHFIHRLGDGGYETVHRLGDGGYEKPNLSSLHETYQIITVERVVAFECLFRELRKRIRGVEQTFATQLTIAWQYRSSE